VWQLEAAAKDFLSAAQYYQGRRTHALWDSQPIAINLQDAYLGFPCDGRWGPATSQLLCELTMENGRVKPIPGANLLCAKPLHKLIYGKFMEIHFVPDIRTTIRSRLTDLLAPHSIDFDNLVDLDVCFALLRKMRTCDAMTIMKT